MKSIKLVGSCLLALLVFSSVLTGSALAKTPPTGPIKYADEGEGGAELGTNVANIKCTSHGAAGEVTSASGGPVTATYKGCEVAGKGIACENIGPKEIQTTPLINALGWINKAKGEVGILFKPASGERLAEFTCSGLTKVNVYGAVIGKVTSKLNEMSESTKVAFEGENFKNNPTSFEGGPEEVLLSEFPEVTGSTKTNSEQKQKDTVHNTATVECKHVGEPKEKCKADPAEISTDESKCEETEVAGKKGPEKVTTCTIVPRTTPQYGRCEKKKAGLYADSNCTTAATFKKGKSKGKYEFEPIT